MTVGTEVVAAVRAGAEAARGAADSVAAAAPETVDAALRGMAERLAGAGREPVLAANAGDVRAGGAGGLPAATLDRLRLDADRLAGMAHQLRVLAEVPHPAWKRVVRELPGSGAVVEEHRRPVGVI